MKIKLTKILVITYLLSAQACKKTIETPDSPKEKTKMELIMAGKWQIKAILVDPPMVISGKTVTNFYDGYTDCEKDGFQFYKADSILVFDEGPLKCNSSSPQTRNSKWYFTTDYSMIKANLLVNLNISSIMQTMKLHLNMMKIIVCKLPKGVCLSYWVIVLIFIVSREVLISIKMVFHFLVRMQSYEVNILKVKDL